MRNRFKNACQIQQGACNVNAIARSLVEACDEVIKDWAYPYEEDAAVRLIVHQLAHLCNIYEINNNYNTYYDLVKECEDKSEKETNEQ